MLGSNDTRSVLVLLIGIQAVLLGGFLYVGDTTYVSIPQALGLVLMLVAVGWSFLQVRGELA